MRGSSRSRTGTPAAAVTAAAADHAGGSQSAITDVSYRNYEGELHLRPYFRWWTVTVATIRANVNRKKLGYWVPAALILVIYFFMGILHYLTQNVRDQMSMTGAGMMGGMLGLEAPVNQYAVTFYQSLSATLFLLFIAALTIGSGSIAADNRANALLVYFARPITRFDYLFGKWMGIFLLLAALTVVPALLMYAFFAVTYYDVGFLSENPWLILRLLAATLIPAALQASLVLGFSAWSKAPRLAAAVYAGFYFLLGNLTVQGGRMMLASESARARPQTVAVVSNMAVDGVASGMALHLLDVTPRQVATSFEGREPGRRNRPPRNAEERARRERREQRFQERLDRTTTERPDLAAMLLIGGAMILLPLAAAHAKVRAVEVIRG